MAIVYRIENWEGFGPYSQIAPKFELNDDGHPDPGSDGLYYFLMDWVFGFGSLSDLSSWFGSKEIRTLGLYGEKWLVSKYEIDSEDLERGRRQVAFDKSRAKYLGCIHLDGLLESEVSLEALDSRFQPHAVCLPQSHHSSFDTDLSELEECDRSLILRQCFENLVDGCYYYIGNWGNVYVYRSGRFYDLRAQTGTVGKSVESIQRITDFIAVLRPPGKRTPSWDRQPELSLTFS